MRSPSTPPALPLLPLLAVLSALALAACPGSHASRGGASPADSVVILPGSASASASTPEATSSAPEGSSGAPGLGAVPAPVISDDECASDADCAPVAVCHAERCGARAKVGTLMPGMMCTADCRGGTVDCGYNHCGCLPLAGGHARCALLPGRAAGR